MLKREAGITSSDGLGANDHSNPTFYKHGYERLVHARALWLKVYFARMLP